VGVAITCNQGLFVVGFVGVALRLAQDDTDEAVGDGGPPEYQLGSSWCRFIMDMVWLRWY